MSESKLTADQQAMVDGALALEAGLEGRVVGAADLLMPARLAGPLARLVKDLEAHNVRLTAERAALLAPVEGVDLEEVLRLDREGTPAERWTVDTGEWREDDRYVRQVVVNKYEEVTKEYDFDDFPARATELAAALAPIKTDEALIALYRIAAPALAREVARLRAAVRFADEQGAEAIARVSSAIVADKWRATAAFQERAFKAEAEVARLRADLEETRLTVAAEQGRAEGAPSPGWEPCRVDDDGGWGWRKKTADGFLFAQGARVIEPVESEYGLQRHPGGWERWLADSEEFLAEKVAHGLDDTWTARAAMLAADAATEAR